MSAGRELRSDAEDCMDELALRDSIALGDPSDLTFAGCMHRLVALDDTRARGQNPIDAAQLPRIHVLKALHDKGVTLSRLARGRLDLNGQAYAYVVYDGQELRGCADASSAIGAVVAGKRWVCGGNPAAMNP